MKRVSLKMTNRIGFRFIPKMLLIFLAIVTGSCSNDDDQPTTAITEISQEIKNLIYFKGDEKAATVLITVSGGPGTVIGSDTVDDFSPFLNPKGILTVAVHQAQTLNPEILAGNDITLAQASSFDAESTEMLGKVIAYFKNQGRTVYVVGLSFGSFVTQDLIAKKGINSADKYLILAGRLDMNEIVWQAAAEGKTSYFENGITPIINPEPNPDVKERNLERIGAGFVMNRYTQLFNSIESLCNLTYIYGEVDQAVGALTANEIQFLESKNANVIKGPGDHDDTLNNFLERGFEEAFDITVQ
ncbi:hypothetical protein ABN763_14110 [Spongiivirga sp. MCCC 1A20706]|uniref:hypothetical protein n=1 Tax=Spongiivirga sp. MCCC 1A20706 TaxID=3160963 RepID=UPI0039774820